MAPVSGVCDRRFERVRAAFAASFDPAREPADQELGASFCVVLDGTPVIDLWGGHLDLERRRPWARDTRSLLMSATKGIGAIVAHLLIDQGALNLDAPLGKSWPAFGSGPKADITLDDVLSHRAGMPLLSGENRNIGFEHDVWRRALEQSALLAPPGAQSAYHAVTFGYLLDQHVRSVTRRSVPEAFSMHLAAACDGELSFGLSEDYAKDCATFSPLPHADPNLALEARPDHPAVRAVAQMMTPIDFNASAFRRACVVSANGFGTARGLAYLYARLLGPQALLSKETLARAIEPRFEGPEALTGLNWRMGAGLMRNNDFAFMGPNAEAFGHPGSGGCIGFADPVAGLAVGYVPNRPYPAPGASPRLRALVNALYDVVGEP